LLANVDVFEEADAKKAEQEGLSASNGKATLILMAAILILLTGGAALGLALGHVSLATVGHGIATGATTAGHAIGSALTPLWQSGVLAKAGLIGAPTGLALCVAANKYRKSCNKQALEDAGIIANINNGTNLADLIIILTHNIEETNDQLADSKDTTLVARLEKQQKVLDALQGTEPIKRKTIQALRELTERSKQEAKRLRS
jgi:tetrahydromethanopterin S-methyltransferase subunit A